MAFHIDENHYNEALKFFIREKGVPVKIILAHADISRSRFYGYLNGAGDLAMSRLISILEIIHVSLDEFMLYARSLQEDCSQNEQHSKLTVVDELTIEQALDTYRKTKDVAVIVSVIDRMNMGDRDIKLLKKILPTVRDILSRRHYFSLIDAHLLLMTMDNLRYDDLRMMLPFVRKTILHQQSSQQIGSVTEIRRQHILLTIIYQYTLRTFHEQANDDAKIDFNLIDNLDATISDWYTNVIRKLMTVIQTLVVTDNEYEARVAYNNILAAVYAIQPQSAWNSYEQLMHSNFNDFKAYALPQRY
ncbi:hypothetical protein [Leuconostoc falkenbergense]|uniref:hypothetical protein n=1 Tax=Leuconostoc falkenbergense TaxID=2766470 RepID=UPI0024A97F3E|nr:hypothetical protein [Leuconostoc falkenbergense]MDI6553365.1 hypothetical protein [Leuconostoc falkenbergense]